MNEQLLQGKPRCQEGFSYVELVTIMVIVGVLAVMAAPRFFDRNLSDSRSFYDQVVSILRYAQKAAIAQRRYVCVAFTSNSVTLTTGATVPCATNLTGPTGMAPYSASSGSASFAVTPSAFNFDALGRASATQSIAVNGHPTAIVIEAETGYVH